MGRKKRSRIEYARTMAWYDFISEEAKKLWNCHSEYQFYKQIYQHTGYDVSDNIFKKYKFGLSSPSKAWLLYAEKKIESSKEIFDHPIWSNFDNKLDTKNSIAKKMHQLPEEIRQIIIEEGFGAPTPTTPETLRAIISYHSIDSLCAIYLLYCWGETTNNLELSNLCADLIFNNLECILINTPYLKRAHIFLFDELCVHICKRSNHLLTIPHIDVLDWRGQRSKKWTEEVKLASFAEEILLLSNSKLENFSSSTNSPISITDRFFLEFGKFKFENKYVEKRFKKERKKCLDKHFAISMNI